MPIESATYIDQLNAAWPLPTDPISEGDNHLQLIKGVLQSQFTSLGAAAVVRTAAELNAVTDKVTRFNGRGPGAITPAKTDYPLGLLTDVTITAPAFANTLGYNGSAWVNGRAGFWLQTGRFLFQGYLGSVGSSMYFATTNFVSGVPAAIGTIKNDGAGGIGWTFTAILPCIVNISLMCSYSNASSNSFAIYKTNSGGTPPTAMPAISANRIAYVESANQGSSTASSEWVMAAGEILTVYQSVAVIGSLNTAMVSGSVTSL